MLAIKLRQLLLDKSAKEGRAISITEVAETTGVGRATLSHIANVDGYNTTTDVVAALIRYFDCRVDELVEWVPDEGATKPTRTRAAVKKPAVRKAVK